MKEHSAIPYNLLAVRLLSTAHPFPKLELERNEEWGSN